MRATTLGLLMVWPRPMGSAVSSYACASKALSTKRWRSTLPMARSTCASLMPSAASNCTMRARAGIGSRAMLAACGAEVLVSGGVAAAGTAGRATGRAGARLPAPRSMRAGKPGRCGGVAISRALRPACA